MLKDKSENEFKFIVCVLLINGFYTEYSFVDKQFDYRSLYIRPFKQRVDDEIIPLHHSQKFVQFHCTASILLRVD